MAVVEKKANSSAPFNAYPFWAPRFWTGMIPWTWLYVLASNRFRVAPRRWAMAISILILSTVCWPLAIAQTAIYGRRIRKTKIDLPPIFILGHWRSGTTLLHELLTLDDRFASPTTSEVYIPNYFLVVGTLFSKMFARLLPRHRPMDDVNVQMESPQEDEWAMCNLGVPSPYLRVLFPDRPAPHMEYLELTDLSSCDRHKWQRSFRQLLQSLTLKYDKRLILKSPPHMGRLPVLLEMFPEAKFIHVVRDPYEVFVSTVRMWKSFDESQGLQPTDEKILEEFVLETHSRLYTSFDTNRGQLDKNQLVEVRYEDLLASPLDQIRIIYQTLQLGAFDAASDKMQDYLDRRRDYVPNRHQFPAEVCQAVTSRWSAQIDRYGYPQRNG
ncbi:MAG: sulfotransferase [Pirellulales bacterium]